MNAVAPKHIKNVHELPHWQYEPVNHERNEIRLFSLDTTKTNAAVIHGKLETFSTEDCPPFRALSYEWGVKQDMHVIVVEGCRLDIRSNLIVFLESYRDRLVSATNGSVAYLWADQLCIDQRNDLERNHQVSLMGRIFSQANEVIAWLGPGFAVALHDLQSYEFGGNISSRENMPKLPTPLTSLLKSSYWQRLWVQQEIALAQNLVLASESTWMPFADIKKVMSDIRVFYWYLLTRDAPALFWHIEPRYENAESYSLYDAIEFYASKLCEDPRDKVYGLLGMVSRRSQKNIVVDYRLSVREVYAMAVRALSTDARVKQGEDGLLDLESCRELGEFMGISDDEITSVFRDINATIANRE